MKALYGKLDEKDKRKELDEIRELLKRNLDKVVQNGKRADSIVKNMLQHSRQGSGEQRSIEINTIVDESLNLAYHGARAEKQGFNITLERDFDPAAGAAVVLQRPQTTLSLDEHDTPIKPTSPRCQSAWHPNPGSALIDAENLFR